MRVDDEEEEEETLSFFRDDGDAKEDFEDFETPPPAKNNGNDDEDIRGAHPSRIDANDCGRASERVGKRAQVGRGTTVRVSADDERGDGRRRRGGFEKRERDDNVPGADWRRAVSWR